MVLLESLLPAVFVAVVVGTLSVIVFAVVRGCRQSAEARAGRAALALDRGWKLTEGGVSPVLWTFTGQDGLLVWRVDGIHKPSESRNSGGARWTQFVASAPSGVEGVALGPKLPEFLTNSLSSSKLVQAALRATFGEEVADLLARAERAGELPELADLFAVLTTDRELSGRLLSERVRQALVEASGQFRKPPLVTFWKDELSVRVEGVLDDPVAIRHLVTLGTQLLQEASTALPIE
jgi:hypothetical protein